jgi:hypothetical protein
MILEEMTHKKSLAEYKEDETTPENYSLRHIYEGETYHSRVISALTPETWALFTDDEKKEITRKTEESIRVMRRATMGAFAPYTDACPLKPVTMEAYKRIGGVDQKMWRAFLKDYYNIDVLTMSEEFTSCAAGQIVVPVQERDGHNYTLGIPVALKTEGVDSLYRVDKKDRGNNLTRCFKALRRATDDEVKAYWIMYTYAHKA